VPQLSPNRRFSKTKKNHYISSKKTKSGKWEIKFYDNTGERKTRTIVAKTRTQAEKAGRKLVDDLKDVTLAPLKNIFNEDQINSVIDAALKDKRIDQVKYDKYMSLSLAERTRQTKHFRKVVDGVPLYDPIPKTMWKMLQENLSDFDVEISKKEIERLQWSYGRKVAKANQLGVEIGEELAGELEYISQAKSLDDVKSWERQFDHKYADLVGDWKNVSASIIVKSPEDWVYENIRNHARRKFMLDGNDKPTAIKLASQYMKDLSKSELDDWYKVMIPIKSYNDSVYKLALDTDNVGALDNILAVHHLQPVSYGGEVLNPKNIRGISGGRHRMSRGSDHRMVHDKMFDSWYEGQKNLRVTVGETLPKGAPDIFPRLIDPRTKEVMPSDMWIPGVYDSTAFEREYPKLDIDTIKKLQNIDFYDLLKNNPKKAMMAMALSPFIFGYSMTGAAQDKVPEGLLNVPREDRFLGTQEADNIWQATKYHTFKPGGALEWANIFDYTDLPFFGKGPQRYDTNLKTIEERKLRDPTWEY